MTQMLEPAGYSALVEEILLHRQYSIGALQLSLRLKGCSKAPNQIARESALDLGDRHRDAPSVASSIAYCLSDTRKQRTRSPPSPREEWNDGKQSLSAEAYGKTFGLIGFEIQAHHVPVPCVCCVGSPKLHDGFLSNVVVTACGRP